MSIRQQAIAIATQLGNTDMVKHLNNLNPLSPLVSSYLRGLQYELAELEENN